ncbi:MAG: preprotein translocase subunit SecY [Thermoguttaceae bacterium]|nr:preprotein translocase subunit SecY [Thermoguttaceae bacterium]MBQ9800593.1 preprotein translocase subunit SecY [Thermoguttaceae bacterium]
MIDKLRIIFSITELRKKILLTIGLIAVYRIGWNIFLPMVDDVGMRNAMTSGAMEGFGNMLSQVAIFSGTQLDQMTIFGLGVMPYISASIIFQLLATVYEPLEKLQKEGESGRKKINEYTRYATILICVIQSAAYLSMLNAQSANGQNVFLESCVGPSGHLTFAWYLLAILTMTTGTAFLMWLGEQIDEYGIGNGISLLIMAGILASAPGALVNLWDQAGGMGTAMGPEKLFALVLIFIGVVLAVVFVTKGQRRIPTQSAKHVRGRQVYGGARQYLPLRVNQAGVMPIIFASSLLLFPQFLFTYLASQASGDGWWTKFVAGGNAIFTAGDSYLYVVMEIVLIYFFCYFWTAVTFNPKDMAENLKNHGTFIQGYRPGASTANYLEKVMLRITYVGASFLAVIAIVPTLVTTLLVGNENYALASFFGGTSLLIAVSVALDLVDKIDAHLIMRNYKSLLE